VTGQWAPSVLKGNELPDTVRARQRQTGPILRKVSFWQHVLVGSAFVCVRSSLDVVVIGNDTRIRLDDPTVTFTGRLRYVLEYRLPDARVSGGRLDLGIKSNDETFETQRFEAVLTGFAFDSIECFSGAREALGGCSSSGARPTIWSR